MKRETDPLFSCSQCGQDLRLPHVSEIDRKNNVYKEEVLDLETQVSELHQDKQFLIRTLRHILEATHINEPTEIARVILGIAEAALEGEHGFGHGKN